MLEKLISEGEALKGQMRESMGLRIITGVPFETWLSKSILFMERDYADSSLTQKAVTASNSKTQNNSGQVYNFVLGTLIAFKEFGEE